jgi:WD40 repeat protein
VERSDVFVSYSRKDAALVRRLVDALEALGKLVWVDFDDIPPSVDWFDRIAAGIDASDNFLCVISPDWVASGVCHREVDHAAGRNKRMIPALARAVEASLVPPAAAKINWISFERPEELDDAIRTLVEQMETDLEHVQGHTRWGQEAQDWERHERDDDYLLRGTELSDAERWLTAATGKEPVPTSLQSEFLVASRQAASRRQRRLVAAVSVALAVSVLLTIFALVQRSAAIDQRNTALSRELGAQAERSYARDPELAILLAAEGVKAQASAESEDTLRTALVRSRVRARHDLGAPVESVDVSPDNELYVVSTSDQRGFVYALATSKRVATFATHTLGADVVWDPASRRVAVGGNDGVARVFDARTGRAAAQLETGHDVVTSVAWSPDSRRLAVTADDTAGSGVATRLTGGVAQVWDVASKRKVATLGGHPRGVSALAWTGDGKLLLTGGYDPAVRVWRADGWTLRTTLRHADDDYVGKIHTPALGSGVAATETAPRGPVTLESVASGGKNADRVGTRVWDLHTGELIRAFARSIGPVAIHPSGEELAFGPPGNVIQVFDVQAREPRLALFGHDGPIRALRYDASGVNLVSSSADGTARVWNPGLSRLVATFAGHDGEVVAGEADANLRRVVTGGQDGTARVWSIAPEAAAATHIGSGAIAPGRALVPALSPDGRFAATRGGADVVDVWDARSGKALRSLDAAAGAAGGAVFSHDGKRLVTAHAGSAQRGEAVIWDSATWTQAARVRPAEGIGTLSLSPSDRLATTGDDGSVSVWTLDGERAGRVRTGHGVPNDALLSDDGETLVTTATDRTATLWSVAGGRRLHELRGHGGPVDPNEAEQGQVTVRDRVLGVVTADFSPDGRQVATAGADGTARVWDVASGKLRRVMRGHTQIVSSVQFSPDGSRLLTGSPDGTARVWRVDTGAQIRSVDHLAAEARTLAETRAAWTSDGEYFVTEGVGSTSVSMWDAGTGLRLVQALGERAAVQPGGHALVTSYATLGEVYRCETCAGVDGLMRLVPARTTRELTREERIRYLHASP